MTNFVRGALLVLFGLSGALAQEGKAIGTDGPGIAWEQLSIEQQHILASAQSTWNQLPPGRQIALANGAKRFIGMDEAQRQLANQRFAQWRKLTDRERADIAERFRLFRGLSPEDRQRLRQTARRFDRMHPVDRDRMRQQFQELSPEARARLRKQIRDRQVQPRPR